MDEFRVLNHGLLGRARSVSRAGKCIRGLWRAGGSVKLSGGAGGRAKPWSQSSPSEESGPTFLKMIISRRYRRSTVDCAPAGSAVNATSSDKRHDPTYFRIWPQLVQDIGECCNINN